jgi:curved DNA-binding protein CbpA
MSTRRAALDGLGQIMDATSLEDLFVGSDEEAAFMFELLAEAARGRTAGCYWEICRTARRRGVSPEYVADRAAVLLASIEERRRSDVYRILGVSPLASDDAIRHRWLDFAKTGHPDIGGDPTRFRQVRDAYELLRDAERRGEYEKYWLKALGPFERVVPRPDDEAGLPHEQGATQRRVVMVGRLPGEASLEPAGNGRAPAASPPIESAPPPAAEPPPAVVSQAAHPTVPAEDGLPALMAGVRALLSRIDGDEIGRLRTQIDHEIAALEIFRAQLRDVARLKRVLPGAGV